MATNNGNVAPEVSSDNSKPDIRERLAAMYGENREITGDFDPELSAKCKNGTFVGKLSGEIIEFRGIPFAKPPVGDLRWKRPEAVEDRDGVFEAYYNGKSPIQTEWGTEQASYYRQGEDCLYLNIWLNKGCTVAHKPVIVFLHGGSYGWGGTADPMYDGSAFVTAEPDIIMVTVGYRVGLMGFVDLSYLEGGGDYPDAPNLGLLDQIEALRWVRANIEAFGGDPDNVTVMGESAGGGSVSLLPIIDEAKGLFRRVIGESGSVALTFSKEECREFTKRLIKTAGTRKMSDLLKLSEDELKVINESVDSYNNFPQRDGKLIPTDPYEPYKNGVTADIDMLIGTNSDEINYWVGEVGGIVPFGFSMPVKFENDMRALSVIGKHRVNKFMSRLEGHKLWRIAEFYNEMMFRLPAVAQAEAHAEHGGKAYMYLWTIPSTITMRNACHAVELAYVFGNREETIYTGQVADEKISDTIMQMWTNFARTGNPSTDRVIWERYNGTKRATMILSETPHLQDDPLSGRRKLLFPLLKHMINPSYADLDYNVPFVKKVIAGGAALLAGATYLTYKLIKKK